VPRLFISFWLRFGRDTFARHPVAVGRRWISSTWISQRTTSARRVPAIQSRSTQSASPQVAAGMSASAGVCWM